MNMGRLLENLLNLVSWSVILGVIIYCIIDERRRKK